MNTNDQRQFSDFKASRIWCPKCKQAMPVRQRLLLVLPDGELYQYLCAKCGADLGAKREKQNGPHQFR